MQWMIEIITSKAFAAVALTSVILFELSHGFLKEFKAYLKTVSWKIYFSIIFAAAVPAGMLLTIDQPLLDKVQALQAPWPDIIALGVFWGRASNVWGLFAAIYWLGFAFKKLAVSRLFYAAMVSSALTSLAVHIIKYIVARARPLVEAGPYHFFQHKALIEEGSRYLSFSSGDVAIAAGAMSLFFIAIKNPLRYLFLIPGFLNCLSRIYLDKHWPSDAAFSYLISFGFAVFVWSYFEYRRKA